ncbi:MAG: hypothetical protein AAF550_05105, partial [Myxococcota bacterium]
ILLVASDYWVAPLLYLTEAERVRSDVVVLAWGLTSSSWYWNHLWARHPDLHQIAMHGGEGKLGRIARFLSANSKRALMIEPSNLLDIFETTPCATGWLAHMPKSGRACPQANAADATSTVRRLTRQIQMGSPPTHEVLANIALWRGAALWKQRDYNAALEALLSGVPDSSRLEHLSIPDDLEEIPALEIHEWTRAAAVADPARNLFVAGVLLSSAGQEPEAHKLFTLARKMGLPETTDL